MSDELGEFSMLELFRLEVDNQATILNDGTGLADQIVTFSFSGTGDGYFTPAVDTTDANGIAASVFTATTSGTPVAASASNSATCPPCSSSVAVLLVSPMNSR